MDHTLWLCEEVYRQVSKEAEYYAPLETGGVLLGYWSSNGELPVVTSFLGPGPKAVHSRRGFVPDQSFHLRGIAELYSASGRRLTYLGDWHTHPGNAAYLSATDLRTLRKIASEPKARAPRPVMMVLAPGPVWRASAWRGEVATLRQRRTKFTVWPLQIVVTNFK
jgi:integrative and conjugative element protein (TIGR02256 family)